jgi:hypothetical protein
MPKFAEPIGQTPDGLSVFSADTILKDVPAPPHVSLFAPGCSYLGYGLRAEPRNPAFGE